MKRDLYRKNCFREAPFARALTHLRVLFAAASAIAVVVAGILLHPSLSFAVGPSVDYPGGAAPDSAVAGQVIDFSVSLRNTGTDPIEDLWLKLDIHEPGGTKVENTQTDYVDIETQELGLLFWPGQGESLPASGQVEFAAGYSLWQSVVDHRYLPGDYTVRYRAWDGQPGAVGSAPIGEIQEETLTIAPISAPNVSVPILMYHRVDDVAPDEYWVFRDEFEAQMKALAAYGYEAISTREIYDHNYGGADLPAKPVSITFDDGYENVYTHAYPVLLEQGLFGEVFIVTNVTALSDYDRKFSRGLGYGILANPHLTWPEIIEMAAGGMVFGSHTASHRDLTTLTDLELEEELAGSQQELFQQAGITATSFSYPLGAGDDDVELHQLLARYGYKTAVSAWRGICQTQGADPLDLQRVYIYGPHPAISPDSNGVSVNYNPSHPEDFFMTKLDPDFPVPRITIESVKFLDEFGSPRQYNRFYPQERILVRIRARNDGDIADVAVSLKLDDDGVEPLAYDSHATTPPEDITSFFAGTGGVEIFEFLWEVPSDPSTNLYDYSIEFHDQTNTLGYYPGGWVSDAFAVCGPIHLLVPADGAYVENPPVLMWHPGCDDVFAVEFSLDPEFRGAKRMTPILSSPSYSIPATVWNRIPRFTTIYWRAIGADTFGVSPGIHTSIEAWSFIKQ